MVVPAAARVTVLTPASTRKHAWVSTSTLPDPAAVLGAAVLSITTAGVVPVPLFEPLFARPLSGNLAESALAGPATAKTVSAVRSAPVANLRCNVNLPDCHR